MKMQCRFMCVDTVFEAIFNCDAMPGDLLTLFSKQFSIAMPHQVICVLNDLILNGADCHVCRHCFRRTLTYPCHAR